MVYFLHVSKSKTLRSFCFVSINAKDIDMLFIIDWLIEQFYFYSFNLRVTMVMVWFHCFRFSCFQKHILDLPITTSAFQLAKIQKWLVFCYFNAAQHIANFYWLLVCEFANTITLHSLCMIFMNLWFDKLNTTRVLWRWYSPEVFG